MAAIMNGLALHGGIIPYGGTFLIFANYLWPALRMSAMMNLRVLYVLTHDSIGLGEDGPTHQPIETLAALRATPNVLVFRPCDPIETIEAYEAALDAVRQWRFIPAKLGTEVVEGRVLVPINFTIVQ